MPREALKGVFRRSPKGTRRGAAFRQGSRRLAVGVVTLSSSAAARSALRRTARGFRRTSRLGDEARLRSRKLNKRRGRRSRVEAVVVLRVDNAIAVVRLTATGQSRQASATTVRKHAGTLVARLRRVLELTPWERTLDGIRNDGSYSTDLALKAFSMAYGPLPGVRLPRGPSEAPPDAGTLAIGLVDNKWDQLTPQQRAAVDRAVGAPHGPGNASVARTSQNGEPLLTPDATYQAIVDGFAAAYRARGLVGPPIRVFRTDRPIPTSPGFVTFADAVQIDPQGRWGSGLPIDYCRVRVAPVGQAPGPFQLLVLAHETFHCFQYVIQPNWAATPLWVREGMADWAATSIVSTTASVGAGPYKAYLSDPSQELFTRSYDGVGFWHRADEFYGVGSLWGKVRAIISVANSSSPGAFAAAGAATDAFAASWTSAISRFPGAGPAWNQGRPYPLGFGDPRSKIGVVDGDSTLVSFPYSGQLYNLGRVPRRPLVLLENLAGQLRAASRGDLGLVRDQSWLCLAGECKCPPGRSGRVPPHQAARGTTALALTGGRQRGRARVEYHSLDEFCKKDDEPEKPDTGGGGGGGGRGGIEVYSNDEGIAQGLAGTLTSGSCSFGRGGFRLTARGGGGSLTLRLPGARRPGSYDVPVGSSGLSVSGFGGSYSSGSAGGFGGGNTAAIVVIKRITVGTGKRKRVRHRVSLGAPRLGSNPSILLKPAPGGLIC